MPGTSPQSPELLLEQVTWIRELAKHLVADESARDDLVQETCMRALERPPRDASRIRHWLASVMRNLVRQNARGDGRRELREERSAAREALEPTAGLVERVAVQRELVDTVLEIDEPYRSSLLMRYFEERPPR
jgi:DNA-directed RNA polymerase specialized sigma24 family protein